MSEPENRNAITVGVGELGFAEHPYVLVTQALGSCVGLALWDPLRQAGALAHIMLPSGEESTADGHMDRFADIAVPNLVRQLTDQGSPKRRLVAKLAGGAAMFQGDSSMSTIGDRNVQAVCTQLSAHGIPLRGQDTGGSHARTIELHLDTGILLVRSYLYGLREI